MGDEEGERFEHRKQDINCRSEVVMCFHSAGGKTEAGGLLPSHVTAS
jgi:hypothetical protein